MAIASFVLSLVWLCGLGSLLAIIFGRKAKAQIAETGEQGDGLATAGVVIGIIGLVGFVLYFGAILAVSMLGESADQQFKETELEINRAFGSINAPVVVESS